jgi:hypothetical protein
MSSRTIYLSKLIGLYCLLISLGMVTHKQATLNTVSLAVHDSPVILILGAFTLAIGLALVVGHNVWSGGAMPVIVTLIGWLTLFKGLAFLFLSPDSLVAYFQMVHYAQMFYVYLAIDLVLGAYLTYAGFSTASR